MLKQASCGLGRRLRKGAYISDHGFCRKEYGILQVWDIRTLLPDLNENRGSEANECMSLSLVLMCEEFLREVGGSLVLYGW